MKLLIVLPGPLYPILGMSQVRVFNQVKRLARDHECCFTDIVSKPAQKAECLEKLGVFVKAYYPVYAATYGKSRLYRVMRFGLLKLAYQFSIFSLEELTLRSATVKKQLAAINNAFEPDAVLIHYWYLGRLFNSVFRNRIRMIDTHYVVEENIELLSGYRYSPLARLRFGKELKHSLKMQNRYFALSDLIVVNSGRQAEIIRQNHPEFKVQITVNGQDIDEYINYRTEQESNTILFYGALSNQFNRLGLETLLVKIYPRLKKDIPGLKLYVAGNNPPMDILDKHQDESIIVTGFVEDIKPVVAKCSLMILPLATGSGFRGRAVEVMALGVPIVGTSNALQSLGFTNGVEGYIADSADKIVENALSILMDDVKRNVMSAACRSFAKDRFSIEATFGVLSAKLQELKEKAGSDE